MLYDFYGQLLTAKQQKIMEMFYGDDLSLSEIANEFGISRQAVYDILKRTEKSLESYEAKLALIEKFLNQQRKIAHIGEIVSLIKNTHNLNYLDEISCIIEDINDIERK